MSVRRGGPSGLDDRLLTNRLEQVLKLGLDTGPSPEKRLRESDDPNEDKSDDDRKRKPRTARFGYIDKNHNYSVTETGARDYTLPTRAGLVSLLSGPRWNDVCDWRTGSVTIKDYVRGPKDQVIYVIDGEGNLIAAALVKFPSMYTFKNVFASVLDTVEKEGLNSQPMHLQDYRSLFKILKENGILFEFEFVCTAGSTRGKLTQSENCLAGVSSWMIYGVVNLVYNTYVTPILDLGSFTRNEEQLLRIFMLKLDALYQARTGWEALAFQHLLSSPVVDHLTGLYADMFRVMFPDGKKPSQPRDLRDCPEAPTESPPSVEY